MKKLVIFDFDGTVADTSEGILYCYRETARLMNYPPAPEKNFDGVIGGNVDAGFRKVYGMSTRQSEKAALLYRQLYAEKGMYMLKPYDGIEECFKQLKDCGFLIALATLKHEKFAKPILDNLGLSQYFDCICAYNGDKNCDKQQLLHNACRALAVSEESSVLIGDSAYDAEGAKSAGIDFVAVTYGFGFSNSQQAAASGADAVVSDVDEIFNAVKAL
ncbi:MAG: HAD family hydrolase [Acutalibacteraceae bacterium]